MPSLNYLVKRLFDMNYQSMFERVDSVSKKSGKSKFTTFCDMVWCGIRYGAGYVDYDVIGFYKLTSAQRKTMLTRGINNKFVKKLNEREYWHLFNNKNEFNDMFQEFLNRKYVYPISQKKEETLEFINSHELFFAKPNDGQCGKNIEKIVTKEWEEKYKENGTGEIQQAEGYQELLYHHLIENKLELLEEPVIQCDEMNRLNPSSVNTTRMVTVMNDAGEVTVLTTFLRIGNGVAHVDNFNSGGMTAKIDVETGVVVEEAVNKAGEVFEKHPLTGTNIKGFQMPFWNEAKEMVKKAAKKSTHVRYVGWDVGMSKDGPVLIEGNQFPGHDIYQVAEKLDENSIGVLPMFEKAMGAKRK